MESESGVRQLSGPRLRWRMVGNGLIAGAAAAIVTTGIAAVASAADVSLEVDATPIPLTAFAFWTFLAAIIGIGLAAVVRWRRRFVGVTVVGTALSIVPAAALGDDMATMLVLVLSHVAAAAMIIPVIARSLDDVSRTLQ